MELKQALKKLEKVLSEARFKHTLRVLKVAEQLADHYEINKKQVQLATVFHDYAKEMDTTQLQKLINTYEIDSRLLKYNKELWHGPVASYMIQDKFNIHDQSVINAIYYHTTGRAKMDMVELTLFIADYIEPARDFPGLDEVREMAFQDLHEAAFLTLKNTIPYLIKQCATIFPDTFYAYNDLLLNVDRRA